MPRNEGQPISRRTLLRGLGAGAFAIGAGGLLDACSSPGDPKREKRAVVGAANAADIRSFMTDISYTLLSRVLASPHDGLQRNGSITTIPGIGENWQDEKSKKAHTISDIAHFPNNIPLFKTKDGKKTVYEQMDRGGISITIPRFMQNSYLNMVNNPDRTPTQLQNMASTVQSLYAYYFDDQNYLHSIALYRTKYGWGININGMDHAYTDPRDAQQGDGIFTQQRLINARELTYEVDKNLRRHKEKSIWTPD